MSDKDKIRNFILMFYMDYKKFMEQKVFEFCYESNKSNSIELEILNKNQIDINDGNCIKILFPKWKQYFEKLTCNTEYGQYDKKNYYSLSVQLKQRELKKLISSIFDTLVEENNLSSFDSINSFFNLVATKDSFIYNNLNNLKKKVIKKFKLEKIESELKMNDFVDGVRVFNFYNIGCYEKTTSYNIKVDIDNINLLKKQLNEGFLHNVFLLKFINNYCTIALSLLLKLFGYSYGTFMIMIGEYKEDLKDFAKANEVMDSNKIDLSIKIKKLSDIFSDELYKAYNSFSSEVKLLVDYNVEYFISTIFSNMKGASKETFNLYEYYEGPILSTFKKLKISKVGFEEFIELMCTCFSQTLDEDILNIHTICFAIEHNDLFVEDIKNIVKLILDNRFFEYIEKAKEKISKENKQKELERILNNDLGLEKEKSSLLNKYESIENGYDFEEFVSELYEKKGYKCSVTTKSKDQGADIIAEKDNERFVIQAKFYNNPVGNKAIQEVVASKAFYNANKAIIVTNSTFTASAIQLAYKNRVELVDKDILLEMINGLN